MSPRSSPAPSSGATGERFVCARRMESSRRVERRAASSSPSSAIRCSSPRPTIGTGCWPCWKAKKGAASRLVVEGDLELQAPSGQVRIGSGEGIELTAGKEVSIASGTFDLHAVDASAIFERMTLIGSTLRADLGAVKAVAGAIDSVVERVTQRAKRVYRFVEEFDQLRAELIDYVATKNASLRGENTVMTATECVKIDGEQVHIG